MKVKRIIIKSIIYGLFFWIVINIAGTLYAIHNYVDPASIINHGRIVELERELGYKLEG